MAENQELKIKNIRETTVMPVEITVSKGKCQGKYHHKGQKFTVDGQTPGGMCMGAWDAISPYVVTLLYGGNFPWENEKGVATIHCPDPKGITLEIKRI
jgi:uncharacterized repeat protein (TIGR04076 family)